MKVKTIIKTGQLFMMAVLLAACASEDVAQDKKKENETEAPKGGVIFAANEPKISAKRLSIGDEDEFAGAKTRTNIKHTPGNGADAYWTSGDFIWVWDKNGMFHSSTHTEIHDGGASAEFTLPGSMSDYADGCEVRYTLGGYGIIHPTALYFSNDKQITAPNDFSIVGGDCGSGKAYATGNPAKFNFRISHKATYLCFLPRCENAALAPNIRLTKIRLTATKCYNNPSYPLCDMYNFDGETIGPGAGYFPSNTMTMEVSDFPLFTTANQEANAVCTIIRPDTYDFKIEYTIKDPTTNKETTITQTLTNKTFDKGKIYDITADLTPPTLPPYYMFDALNPYWYGYESFAPTTMGVQGQHYPGSDPGELNGRDVHLAPASQSCAICPNANEMCWYTILGDPHWQGGCTANLYGHLVTIGGMWLKKKAAIIRDNSGSGQAFSAANGGAARFSNGFPLDKNPASPATNDKDFRTWNGLFPSVTNNAISTISSISDLSNPDDYFFLPAAGWYSTGYMEYIGSVGSYWSSDIDPRHSGYAYGINFSSSGIGVGIISPHNGYSVKAFE